jgi:hypothetical protein
LNQVVNARAIDKVVLHPGDKITDGKPIPPQAVTAELVAMR